MTPSNAKRSKAKNKFGGSSGSSGGAKDVGSSLAEKNERNKEASSVAADSVKDSIPAITIQEAAAAATATAANFSTPPHLHHEVSAKVLLKTHGWSKIDFDAIFHSKKQFCIFYIKAVLARQNRYVYKG